MLSHDNYLCVYLLIYWVYWFCFIVWLGLFFFYIESHSVAQAGHELATIFLTQPHKYCDHRHAQLCLERNNYCIKKMPELTEVTKKANQ